MSDTQRKFDQEEFMRILNGWAPVMGKKHQLYGERLGELGELSIFVRGWDKMARIEHLMWEHSQPLNDEERHALVDAWADIMGYASLWLFYFAPEKELERFKNNIS